jgi:two-component system, LuxR family, response regulator FixJ
VPTPTVFVIDDQETVRDALDEMLSTFGFEVESYASADIFLASARSHTGCVVADVLMPGTDGIELTREIARRKICLPVVLISGAADVPMAVAAIKAGAEDFIEKPVDDVKLIAAINRSMARLFEYRSEQESADACVFARLTPRQVEVFDLVAAGCTTQVIAEKLRISTRTVEGYRAEIMNKLQTESVAVLVRLAIRLGRAAP